MNILGIIPAREGSKRVPQKNFTPFAGSTLTDLAIQQGLSSKLITCLAVSSDSGLVLQLASKYKDVKGIKRPDEFSNDHSPAIDYVRHTLSTLETEKAFDMVVILQPSSPLRNAADIDATIQLLIEHPDSDSAVSVVKVDHMVHPYKLKVMNQNELLPFIEDEAGRFAAHELPDIYVRNCAVYVTWRKDLESRADVIGQKSVGYVMPADTSVDINEPLDFEFAEFLYAKQLKKSH
jgi:CMP-N-acetylneuraminic acid synthetase